MPKKNHDVGAEVSEQLMAESPRAVIYLRVSTKEQAEMGGEAEGYSIPAQRAACVRKSDSLGAVVDEEFVDRGESAKTANRPELARMLRYLEENSIQFVIVHKVDRLARNRADDVAITLSIQKSGATLVSCSENIDETPSGLLLHGIMSSIAEFYSRNLASEVIKGLEQKAKKGGTVHKAPVGYRHVRRLENGSEVRTVEVDPERAPLVKWAFEAYATGEWTVSGLLKELNKRGMTTRPGPHTPPRPLSETGLNSVLRNPYYTGLLLFRGAYHPGTHEPLISYQLFDEVRSVMEAHQHAGERQYRHHHYLKGSIYCGVCGERLAIEFSRSRNGNLYDYFFCLGRQRNPRSCDFRATRVGLVEQRVIDHYNEIEMSPERIERVRTSLLDALATRRDEAEAMEALQNRRIKQLSDEREKLLRLHYADAVPLDLFKQDQKRIMRELKDARDQLAAVSFQFDVIERNLRKALRLAEDCHAAYEEAAPEVRRLFNQAFFEKLTVHPDGEITHELAKPFRTLLDPQLPAWLQNQVCDEGVRTDAGEWGENEKGVAFSDAGGSNFEVLVEVSGLEPLTFWLPARRSPS
jgi:site-specific DNA recombinase